MGTQNRILDALHRGFVDKELSIDDTVRTKFLTNDRSRNITVLDSLKDELERCKSFTFSVAFITESGLNELKTLFIDLKERGIKGRIITSNYLSFNSPKIFKELLKIENIEVRVTDKEGFHSKGYIFEHFDHTTMILGSSNLTSVALKINHEWNLKISSMFDGEIINSVKKTVDEMWDSAARISDAWITAYSLSYVKPEFLSNKNNVIYEENSYGEITPNKMQVAALEGISSVRDENEQKALLVSATGTGKTYLSAFDVKEYKPKRFLFVVHREQILRDAMESFKKVIGNDASEYGFLSGTRKDYDAKYLFATIQSLSLDSNLEKFDRDDFDYIVIDEVHKSGAPSYRKVMDYFTPNFMLGMTATPERTDNINVFELFDYNIAYEIRLQEAIEEDLICPFHYFGVTDYEKDGQLIDETSNLSDLVSKERIEHLIEKMEYYGHSGEKVRGLIFTSKIEEAKEVSNLLNDYNYRTSYLIGEHSTEYRENEIDKLENGQLDYLITVDIFNEGIDIPSVNQVIMMRETQSSIIFIQQLGRGLRLHEDKDFVTVIDYIGNYKNNYMIPMALSGDRSMSKEVIRRKMLDTSYISGISSVNFERIAKERIFDAITTSKLNKMANLKKEYQALRNKLGRIPMLVDFLQYESVDPNIIANYKDSYYDFLVSYDRESMKIKYPNQLGEYKRKILKLYTQEFLNGKRVHEVLLTKKLMSEESVSRFELEQYYRDNGIYCDEDTFESVVRTLDLTFYGQSTRNTYQPFEIIKVENEVITFTNEMNDVVKDETFKVFLEDIIESSILKGKQYDQSKRLTIGELYTRRDASLLLNWDKDSFGVINGYMFNDRTNTCPVFVTYNKVDVEDSVNYANEFINSNTLTWYSKNKFNLKSPNIRKIIDAEATGLELHLFVQKDKKTNEKEFYYLGKMLPAKGKYTDEKMADGSDVVKFEMKLDNDVESHLLKYITAKDEL